MKEKKNRFHLACVCVCVLCCGGLLVRKRCEDGGTRQAQIYGCDGGGALCFKIGTYLCVSYEGG